MAADILMLADYISKMNLNEVKVGVRTCLESLGYNATVGTRCKWY